jgi:hypothetical protein
MLNWPFMNGARRSVQKAFTIRLINPFASNYIIPSDLLFHILLVLTLRFWETRLFHPFIRKTTRRVHQTSAIWPKYLKNYWLLNWIANKKMRTVLIINISSLYNYRKLINSLNLNKISFNLLFVKEIIFTSLFELWHSIKK